MKVLLPSHGILGQTKVNMRIPTFGDLHELQSYNKDELLRKYHFVKLITDVDFTKVTPMDVDYLFTVAAFSLLFNSITYKVVCPTCNEEITHRVTLLNQDVKDLKIKASQLPYVKRIKLKQYSYTILSAQQELDAYDWAQYEDDEEMAFENAKVAFIMGKSLEDVEWVRKLPMPIYAAAFLFQKLNYHGLDYTAIAVCPHCHNNVKFKFEVGTSVLNFSIEDMMARYVPSADKISFTDFLSMSIVDFNAFVSELNKSINR